MSDYSHVVDCAFRELQYFLGQAQETFPSRRERIATAALQAIAGGSWVERPAYAPGDSYTQFLRNDPAKAAATAVALADALISELEKPANTEVAA